RTFFADDSWRRVHAGELEVRPPGAPTTWAGDSRADLSVTVCDFSYLSGFGFVLEAREAIGITSHRARHHVIATDRFRLVSVVRLAKAATAARLRPMPPGRGETHEIRALVSSSRGACSSWDQLSALPRCACTL